MERKIILAAATATTVACILGACGKNAAEDMVPDSVSAETSQGLESTVKENEMETKPSASSDSDSKVTDLTGKEVPEIAIDYDISSYEKLQKFSYDFFGQNIKEENPVLSPVSAYLALSMAGIGAGGATKDEFYGVFGDDMMALSDNMMNILPEDGDLLKLSIANSAWIDDEFTVNDEWIGTVKSLMDAEAFQANLSTTETMEGMNGWINDKTNGMIDKMMEEPLDEMTRLVLFNTIYFKGKWKFPFEFWQTHKGDFYIDRSQNATKQVDMMSMYERYLDYISNDFAEGVILPYQNNEADPTMDAKKAFIALKPKNNGDIRDVYAKLTFGEIKKMLSGRQNELVDLKLPKFETTFDIELNESLKNMGLKTCFDPEKADFTPMGTMQGDGNLYISLVRQKAKIIVDEEGTEAAAVTEVAMENGAMLIVEPPKQLFFDEPFIYMVMDMERELPLFVGILDNPEN